MGVYGRIASLYPLLICYSVAFASGACMLNPGLMERAGENYFAALDISSNIESRQGFISCAISAIEMTPTS